MADATPDALLGLGDYIQHGHAVEWWSLFAEPLRMFVGASLRAVLLVRGNHDVGYWTLFGSSVQAQTWGPCRVVILDSGEDLRPEHWRLQQEWLKREVASDEWRKARWRIVAWHHPWRTELWDGGCYYVARDDIRKLLVDVDLGVASLVLCGHSHSYQRGRFGAAAIAISGGGGGDRDRARCWDWPEIDRAEPRHHFLLIDADQTRLVVRAIDADGKEFDRIVMQ